MAILDDWNALPLSPHTLERYRLQLNQRQRDNLSGGHLMMRRGQSLEFREFTAYQMGDDIRHVDWRTSARNGRGDWVVRRFLAEERATVIISLDLRDTLFFPIHPTPLDGKTQEKWRVSLWLAEALARMLLANGDEVIFHRLAGGQRGAALIEKPRRAAEIRPTLARLLAVARAASASAPLAFHLNALQPYLSPTVVWIVVSDFYFEWDSQATHRLVRALVEAQQGARWVQLYELDSWEVEKELLGGGHRLIEGPDMRLPDPRFNVDESLLAEVRRTIDTHIKRFRIAASAGALDHIRWSYTLNTPLERQFQGWFEDSAPLKALFTRER